ncbi:MAG: DNA polymerase III subunit beta [Rickettsiales bacterium]|nr:DNA polymerase III subunit beta [Rickettsiales bacterium]
MLDESANVKEQTLANCLSIRVNKINLIKGLSRVCSIVERRNVIPILSNVLLEARDNKLILSTTDMDIVVNDSVNAEVESIGSVTVGAHVLYDIIRKLQDDFPVILKFIESSVALNIVSGKSSFMLPTLPHDDFPKLNDEGYDHTFSIPAKEFKKMIDKCKFAIAQEETRYNLNGAYLEYIDGGIRLVSTDGHRLCLVTGVAKNVKQFKGILIPRKTVFEARKIVDECDEDLQITFSNSRVKILGSGVCIISKLIDAAFPDYNALIPKGNEFQITLNSKEFLSAVDRVATVTNDKFKGIKMVVHSNTMLMSASSDTVGGAKEEIGIESNVEKKIEIGFNSRYILDVMAVITGNTVKCFLKDPFAPVVIQDETDDSFRYVVMPMRV